LTGGINGEGGLEQKNLYQPAGKESKKKKKGEQVLARKKSNENEKTTTGKKWAKVWKSSEEPGRLLILGKGNKRRVEGPKGPKGKIRRMGEKKSERTSETVKLERDNWDEINSQRRQKE